MVGLSVLLRGYVFITVSVVLCSSVFLRDPPLGNGEDGAAARANVREHRSVPEWRADFRRRALTFGQSEDEINRVQFYLNQLKEIAATKFHALYSEKTNNNKNVLHSGSSILQPQSLPNELNSELRAWSSSRMSDNGDFHEEVLNPEEHGRHFEGDIVLFPDQAESLLESVTKEGSRRIKRKFIGSKVRRWDPRKPIHYSFDGSHTLREQRVIELALEHWHNITCLNFERRDDEPKGSRIVFTDVDGCASNVGKHPLGEPQFVSLAPECIRLGVIAHEVAHALGFWHEQSRPDRDYFVNVRWENIDRDSKGQFLKEQPIDVDNGGVPYDYGSIMHYRSKAFARYDDLFTLNTFVSDYQRTIGQRDQLSFNDIRLMNVIYCRDACPKQLPCQRGGYTDPRKCDRCRCPDGFTGGYCEQVMPGYGSECGGRIEVKNSWSRIASPGYPNEFREGQECSWMIVAPSGYHVQLQFYGEFEMYCKVRHSLCMDYVEIRNTTDFANTGMRYCCYGTPQTPVYSSTTDLLVLFRSFYRGGKGFQARVRAVPQAEFGNWLEWSSYSECSATCGACGNRIRKRECFSTNPSATCLGNDSETEICAREPCQKGICPKTQWDESECSTGLLSILKGIGACKKDLPPTSSECTEVCCAGFSLVNGLCTRL